MPLENTKKDSASTTRTSRFEVPFEHGNCPHCGVSLDGGGIWEHFYKKFTEGTGYWLTDDGEYTSEYRVLSPEKAAEAADKVSASYGASRVKGRWGRVVGIEKEYEDRVSSWECPDCKGGWPR